MGNPDLSAPPGACGPILLNRRAGARATITGVERWTAELIPRLQALAPERYRLADPPPRMTGRGSGQAWEQTILPLSALKASAALIFSPANLAPVLWPRNVVMVHDAAVLREPAAYSRAYGLWHRTVGLACTRRALRVLTVSEFSRRELIELAGLDPDRVLVVRGGVDERFTPAADHQRAARELGLPRPYVLTVATDDRRKNLQVLAQTAQALDREGLDLVWAGEARPYFAGAPGIAGARTLGYVADELLPGLYRGAAAFVLPSRYEGLGLTCLEAMACGTPVVAADRAALPETCGPAALLVDPDDPLAVAQAVLRAVSDERLAQAMRASGLERARTRTWSRAARDTHAILQACT